MPANGMEQLIMINEVTLKFLNTLLVRFWVEVSTLNMLFKQKMTLNDFEGFEVGTFEFTSL